jgi:phosphate transport system permease protein
MQPTVLSVQPNNCASRQRGIPVFVLLWILFILFKNGFAGLSLAIFTESTPAPGSEGGGLANAIVGSLMMVGVSVLISTPIGIFAGVYLAEFGDDNKLAAVTRL